MSLCAFFEVEPLPTLKILLENICLLLLSTQSDNIFQTEVNGQELEHGNLLKNENYHCSWSNTREIKVIFRSLHLKAFEGFTLIDYWTGTNLWDHEPSCVLFLVNCSSQIVYCVTLWLSSDGHQSCGVHGTLMRLWAWARGTQGPDPSGVLSYWASLRNTQSMFHFSLHSTEAVIFLGYFADLAYGIIILRSKKLI